MPLSLKESPPIQEIVENTPAKEITIEKPMFTTKKTERRGKKVETPTTQRESPNCAICNVVGHPTHIYPELDELKLLLSSKVDIATPHSCKKEPATKIQGKSLCTNNACTICNNYGHYAHHFLEISRYRDTLHAIEQSYQEDPSIQSSRDEPHTILYL